MQKKAITTRHSAGKMSKREFWQALLQLLYRHYTAPLATMFKQFRAGAIYFTVGLMTVLMANAYMAPSVAQELVVLLGLIMGGIGFIVAMSAQVRMIVARIIHFLKKP
jgi:hypothetical protein